MVEIQPQRTLREGIAFTFRGVEPDSDGKLTGELLEVDLVVAPLNFASLRTMQDRIKDFGQADAKSMETLIDCLDLSLGRNYRSVPRWLLEQSVDLGNMPSMMGALMDVSGLRRKEVEDAKKALTAPPVTTVPETGMPFTAT
jgi:hypothetical protein